MGNGTYCAESGTDPAVTVPQTRVTRRMVCQGTPEMKTPHKRISYTDRSRNWVSSHCSCGCEEAERLDSGPGTSQIQGSPRP